MTDQEKKINDIAEALIKRQFDIIWENAPKGFDIEYAFKISKLCAIECQREKVKDKTNTLNDAQIWISGMAEGINKWVVKDGSTVGVFARMDNLQAWRKDLVKELTEAQQVLENLQARLK